MYRIHYQFNSILTWKYPVFMYILLYFIYYDHFFLLIYGIRYGMGILLLHFFIIFVVIPIYGDARICICLQKWAFYSSWGEKKPLLFFCSSVGSRVQSSRYSSSSEAITCIDIASRAAEEFADTIGCQWRPLRFSRKADTNASSIVSQSLADRPYWRSEPENSNHFKY